MTPHLTRALRWALPLWLAAPWSALAHGEFPRTTGALWPDPEQERPVVISNFGVLVPTGADDWSWVCEEVSGEAKVSALAISQGGRWMLGTIMGMKTSLDGCYWSDQADLAGLYVTHIAADVGDPGVVYASTSTGGSVNGVWRSTDGGGAFSLLYGPERLGEGATVRGFLQRIDGAFFVVGWRDSLPRLWFIEPGGEVSTWDIPLGDGLAVYPLSVDGQDPNVVWLRFDLNGQDQLVSATRDGQFTVERTLEDDLRAFSSASNGDLAVGGLAVGMSRRVGGVWSEFDLSPEAGCSVLHGGRQHQCGNNWGDGAALLSAELRSDTWEPQLWFGDVHQVLECPADAPTTYVCEPLWETVKALAGLDVATPTPEATPSPTPEPTPLPQVSSCSCGEGAPAQLLVLLPLLARRRRRAPC